MPTIINSCWLVTRGLTRVCISRVGGVNVFKILGDEGADSKGLAGRRSARCRRGYPRSPPKWDLGQASPSAETNGFWLKWRVLFWRKLILSGIFFRTFVSSEKCWIFRRRLYDSENSWNEWYVTYRQTPSQALSLHFLARDTFVRTNRRAIAMQSAVCLPVCPSVWDGRALWSYGAL